MQVVKPPHNCYILSGLDECTYVQYAKTYSCCKRWGVRGIYVFLTGTGLYFIVRDTLQGTVVQYGKRRIATYVVGAATYICAPAVAVITNATRVVKSCQVIYTGIGYVAEAIEDASQVPFLPVDLVVFGQPIAANQAGRFSSWGDVTDLIDHLPGTGS